MASSNQFYPITENVRQVDWHGGFTAAAGHAVWLPQPRTYPQTYWNRTAFVSEPTGHLIATFLLQRNGADLSSENTWNLVASDDEWTAPIFAEVGPDGNVWMIDWYNFIVAAQSDPTRLPDGSRRRLRHSAPRQDARADLSASCSRGQAVAARRSRSEGSFQVGGGPEERQPLLADARPAPDRRAGPAGRRNRAREASE